MMDLTNGRILGQERSFLPTQLGHIADQDQRTDAIPAFQEWDGKEIDDGILILELSSTKMST